MGVTTSSNSAATYSLIERKVLVSATPTVVFTSIPQTYTDLILVTNDIINTTNVLGLYTRFNSDSNSHYSYVVMEGNGSSASSGRQVNQNYLLIGRSYGGDRSMNIYQIQNYSSSSTYKTAICRYSGGYTSSASGVGVGLWRGETGSSKEAITSITLGLEGGYDFSSGCQFTLYGIKEA